MLSVETQWVCVSAVTIGCWVLGVGLSGCVHKINCLQLATERPIENMGIERSNEHKKQIFTHNDLMERRTIKRRKKQQETGKTISHIHFETLKIFSVEK